MTITGLAAEVGDETLVSFVKVVREEVATVGFSTCSSGAIAKRVGR